MSNYKKLKKMGFSKDAAACIGTAIKENEGTLGANPRLHKINVGLPSDNLPPGLTVGNEKSGFSVSLIPPNFVGHTIPEIKDTDEMSKLRKNWAKSDKLTESVKPCLSKMRPAP